MRRIVKLCVVVLLLIALCLSMTSCFSLIFGFFGTKDTTDFLPNEKELIKDTFGFDLPFLSCKGYDLEFIDDQTLLCASISTSEENFVSYINSFSNFRLESIKTDVYGYDYYLFSKDGWNIGIGKAYDGLLISTVYTFVYPSSYMIDGVESNYGAGLPDYEFSTMNIDFSGSDYKSLKEINSYKYVCPTKGDVNVLVIPIRFSDSGNLGSVNLSYLDQRFNSEDGVSGFFEKSSFGQLNLQFDFYDEWITAPYSSSEYIEHFSNLDEYDPAYVNAILLTALTELEEELDLTRYDSDNDGCIDSIVMINPLTMDPNSSFQWAYKTQNIITDSSGDEFLFDGKRAFNYIWMSNDFLYDENNKFTNEVIVHEFTHTFGISDYYATDYYFVDDPVYGKDLMSASGEDHSPLTKFMLGWINKTTLITDFSDFTVSLSNYWETGETLILANDFDYKLGCYQEYFIVIYSEGNQDFEDGLLIYHVDASLIHLQTFNKITTAVYNDNDAFDQGGSEDNLVELVKVDGKLSVGLARNKSYSVTLYDNKDQRLDFDFTVTRISDGEIQIKAS